MLKNVPRSGTSQQETEDCTACFVINEAFTMLAAV